MNDQRDQPSRHYHAPRRAQQAAETRQAIIQAARTLFGQHGYQATTLQAIARQAEVSVPTLYVVFGSKAAILSALVRSTGADEDIRALARAVFAEPAPRLQLQKAAHVIRSIQERDSDIVDLIWQAGNSDPDLVAAWQQSLQQQHTRQGELIESLLRKGALKDGLTLEQATDIHWALSSPDMYRLLVRERAWTPHQYEEWLAATTTSLLLREG
jgi:AcrR family transcriptional regulator